MNALDGTLGTQLASADVASDDLNSVMVNDQFTYKGKHYVVAGPALTNGKFYMLDVTDPANATLVHELGPIGINPNLTNRGGVIFDDATGRLYIMDTNNAIASYKRLQLFHQ
jgi:choline dehydrogenase-like flavoprotein